MSSVVHWCHPLPFWVSRGCTRELNLLPTLETILCERNQVLMQYTERRQTLIFWRKKFFTNFLEITEIKSQSRFIYIKQKKVNLSTKLWEWVILWPKWVILWRKWVFLVRFIEFRESRLFHALRPILNRCFLKSSPTIRKNNYVLSKKILSMEFFTKNKKNSDFRSIFWIHIKSMEFQTD